MTDSFQLVRLVDLKKWTPINQPMTLEDAIKEYNKMVDELSEFDSIFLRIVPGPDNKDMISLELGKECSEVLNSLYGG